MVGGTFWSAGASETLSEDSLLLKHINKVVNHSGTKKISSRELKSKIIGIYLTRR